MNKHFRNITKTGAAVLMTGILLAACSGEEENKDVAALKAKRDSLKTVQSEIAQQLIEVEKAIAMMDTTLNSSKILVTAEKAAHQSFAHYFEVHGVVESDKNASVTAEMGGAVKSIAVEEGQEVNAGQTLIILDTDIIRKNIEEVETALELANTMYEKQKKLWDQKIGSEVQYLQAKNQKESLEARLASAKSQLSKSIITAPFKGVVDEIFVKVGEMVAPAFPALRLVNTESVYITAEISEEYITSVKKGDTAMIKFSSLNTDWLPAKVNQVGSFINPNNRTFKTKIALIDQKDKELLKPNLLTTVKIKDYENDSTIVLPSSIIQQDASANSYVFVVDNSSTGSTAKKVLVTTGKSYQGKTEILSGIKVGESIIMQGARSVNKGEMVEVKPN